MSDVFEVGQKVRYRGEEVTITYGPYTSSLGLTRYLVKDADGAELPTRDYDLTAIPTSPAFVVGDTVTLATRPGGMPYTVEYGPFDDRDVYVVRRVDEPTDPDDVRTFTALAGVMRKVEAPAVKVGDRVRIVKDSDGIRSGEYVGLVGTLERVDEGAELAHLVRFGDGSGTHGDKVNGRWWCERVEPVTDENTYEHDGVIYDLTARYRDRDGDVWRLKRINGVVRARWDGEDSPTTDSNTLATVAGTWGPLTRVAD